jgi:hypothetical protein
MVFNIGSQTGGVVSNVGRDQHVTGGQHGTAVSVADAQSAAQALRVALERLDLPQDVSATARQEAEQVERELAQPEPDRERVAGRLERLTRVLAGAGALAGAGTGLIGPLTTLAQWLGSVGAPLLRLLPG